MPAVGASKYVVNAGWDDAPHLDARSKAEMLAATPPHLRKARSKGEPSLGIGAIYAIEEESFVVPPFAIPATWRRAFGLDVGWNCTAAVWGAIDDDSETVYLYSEHYMGEQPVPIHASAIKARGPWIPGVIDPAADNRGQRDGERIMQNYLAEGIDLKAADNAVEAGIELTRTMLVTGRLKVFSSMRSWLSEFRIYRRDEHGKIVKKKDHAMDATRYLIMSGLRRAVVRPVKDVVSATGMVADGLGGY